MYTMTVGELRRNIALLDDNAQVFAAVGSPLGSVKCPVEGVLINRFNYDPPAVFLLVFKED